MSIMVSRRNFDIRANYVKRFVKIRDIANFQGGKCTFAPIYLQISAMDGKIISAFLIHITMFTMVSRQIFDKCANYVEIFVIRSGNSEFSRWKMYFCTNLSPNLSDGRVKYFGAFFILGTMSTTV